jgi:hypothetical protein
MSDRMALKIAIDLMHVPSQVRLFRSEPLPDGVPTLLRIAAGDDEAEHAAAAIMDRSPKVVREAATFFIEQILFAPNTDSYRVLGTSPQADAGELRRNVALLLRWLHPDLDPRGERSIFVSRVTEAWNNLKTRERRSTYDELLMHAQARKKSRLRNGKSRPGRPSGGRQFANSMHRSRFAGDGRVAGGKIGFFRRAFSVLFHRQPQ